tara:strand:- start:1260 stop:3302 length:2043 start_codon:yes stop_codon:yes gene_type:complete
MEYDKRASANRELFDRYKNDRQAWELDARQDLDFYLGNHFTEFESQELQQRNQADVPMDRISPAVERLKSMLTSRPPVFTVVPREDSDASLAYLWREIMGFAWQNSEGDAQVKQAIHDYCVVGLGFLYTYIDYDSDFGKGDVKFSYLDPFRVYVPASSRDRFFSDADNIILSTILSEDQVLNLYPELGVSVDPETGEEIDRLVDSITTYSYDQDYPDAVNKTSMNTYTPDTVRGYTDTNYKRFQILERFTKVKVPFYRLVDNNTGQEFIVDEADFRVFIEKNKKMLEMGQVDIVQVYQNRIKVTASIGEVVLYETVLNTDVYPIVPIANVWTQTPYPRSDVSRARPMQRLLNKLWSLALSHAQASAGLKLMVPLGSVENVAQLEKDWANPNAVIEVDSTQGEPHYPAPQPLTGEFYRLIQQCEFYINFIFGIPEIMQGVGEQPQTARGTERLIALGSERPKSKLRDIEFSIKRLGKVMYNYAKTHYDVPKLLKLVQPNNDITETMAQVYSDKSKIVFDLKKEQHNLEQHDVGIESGSTLPTSKYSELAVYMEAYQMGIVDQVEVLKKNPDIFDKDGILKRMNQRQQMQQQIQSMDETIKNLQGDLQTATRESISDRKRTEVEKFKSRLNEVESNASADRRINKNKLNDKVLLELEKLRGEIKVMESEMRSSSQQDKTSKE